MMLANAIDLSTPRTSTVYFLSDEENRTLLEGDCETEDLLHDLTAFLTNTPGVGSLDSDVVSLTADDEGLVLTVTVKYTGHNEEIVIGNIRESIKITIATLRLFSPVLGGYR